MQVVASGIGVGASTLLMALGVGLVQDARARDTAARERAVRDQRASAVRAEQFEREAAARRDEELSRLRERIQSQDREQTARRQAALERLAKEDQANLDRRMREWDSAYEDERARTEQALARLLRTRARPVELEQPSPVAAVAVESDGDEADLRDVRDAVLSGEQGRIDTAIARHNGAPGAVPVFRHDDPKLAAMGVSVRARYDKVHNFFGIMLEAKASSDLKEPCTVVVAPGTIVRAASGYQDTAPIQARFLKVTPRGTTEAPATICCAQIHSNDPSSTTPRGLASHRDARVALVAAAAEREHADWGSAQVAIWAVANNVTLPEVLKAPGNYGAYVDGARDVLEKAGVDTNKLPLYATASSRGRRGTFGGDLVREGLRPMGG